MKLEDPVVVYTAESNVEAHLIVDVLQNEGIRSHAVEDQSTVTLWMGGRISQFHQPNVMVDRQDAEAAGLLIQEFEEQKRARAAKEKEKSGSGSNIGVVCEECDKPTSFPASLDGTTQECSHCHAYVDVGSLPWEDDYGEPIE